MSYEERELPTRPDTPSASARRCRHCGRVYGDHNTLFPCDTAACQGLRAGFEPEEHSDDDRAR